MSEVVRLYRNPYEEPALDPALPAERWPTAAEWRVGASSLAAGALIAGFLMWLGGVIA